MTQKSNKQTADSSSPQLDEEAIRKIGSKLRDHYDALASEPVPDRFTALLDELDKKNTAQREDKS